MKIKEAKQITVDTPLTYFDGKLQKNFVRAFYARLYGSHNPHSYWFGMEIDGRFVLDLQKVLKDNSKAVLRSIDMSYLHILNERKDETDDDVLKLITSTIDEQFVVRLLNGMVASVQHAINDTKNIDDQEVPDELINEVHDCFMTNLEMICYSRIAFKMDMLLDIRKMTMFRSLFYKIVETFIPKFTSLITTFFAQKVTP